MGNEASVAIAAAQAKSKMNKTMDNIDKKFTGGDKKAEEQKLAGCANRKESQERRKAREAEFREKKTERLARKEKLSEMWAANKQQQQK